MTKPVVLVLGSLFALMAAACASSSPTPTPDPGTASSSGGATSSGEPTPTPADATYPKENIGSAASTHNPKTGKVGNRGSIIQNFKFLGYPDGVGGEYKQVSLANYHDPEGKTYKLIAIQAAGSWCSVCRTEMNIKKPIADQLKEMGVALITTLAEGNSGGVASTRNDLDKWMNSFKPNYAQLLDPGNQNLGIFYDAAALPWNGLVDARSMEILSSDVGLEYSTADAMLKGFQGWIDFLATNSLAAK
jgi:hypothetical protein